MHVRSRLLFYDCGVYAARFFIFFFRVVASVRGSFFFFAIFGERLVFHTRTNYDRANRCVQFCALISYVGMSCVYNNDDDFAAAFAYIM